MSSLEIRRLQLPFRVSFEHSSAKRSIGDSVLVIAKNDQGLQGFGEGCPRAYVTGETWETASAFFEANQADFADLFTLDELKTWVKDHQKMIDNNPAAWCAVELALLDLFAKEKNVSIETLLALPKLNGRFTYTAILGASDLPVFNAQVAQYKKMSFTDFKVKVTGDLKKDKERLLALGETVGTNARIRLDANNVWKSASDTITAIKGFGGSYAALEEPVEHNQYGTLAQIAEVLGIPIILDESFLRENQFSQLESFSIPWIINLRISKMGGLLRSNQIAKEAKRRNIRLIVGAHVGESSILTRAALTIANAHRENVMAQEGAFGTFLLEKDIVTTPIQFGLKGQLDSAKLGLGAYGLGISINQ